MTIYVYDKFDNNNTDTVIITVKEKPPTNNSSSENLISTDFPTYSPDQIIPLSIITLVIFFRRNKFRKHKDQV